MPAHWLYPHCIDTPNLGRIVKHWSKSVSSNTAHPHTLITQPCNSPPPQPHMAVRMPAGDWAKRSSDGRIGAISFSVSVLVWAGEAGRAAGLAHLDPPNDHGCVRGRPRGGVGGWVKCVCEAGRAACWSVAEVQGGASGGPGAPPYVAWPSLTLRLAQPCNPHNAYSTPPVRLQNFT
jgi:hypothetical protein